MAKRSIYCFMVFLACIVGGLWANAYAQNPLVMAVHPYLDTVEINKRFSPLAEYLQRITGRPVEIHIGGNYEAHINAIGNNKVDIAFLGPAAYVKLVDRFGPQAVLSRFEVNHESYLYGVIATRNDSPVRNLESLHELRFAFGDPDSTMSHLVPRFMLMESGIPDGMPINHQFVGSHDNVALGVLVGDFDAGAMKKEVFDEYAPQGLRLIATTPPVPDHVFVARDGLPPKQFAIIRDALLNLRNVEGGPAILRSLHKDLTSLIPVEDDAYDGLRRMVKVVETAGQ